MSSSAFDVVRTTIGIGSSCGIGLDAPQRLAAVLPRHVEVEQDQPGIGRLRPSRRTRLRGADSPAAPRRPRRKRSSLASRLSSNASWISRRSSGSSSAIRIVIGSMSLRHDRQVAGDCLAGKVTTNVAPSPGRLAAVIAPPCRSTILRQMASPMPVPSIFAAAVQALEDVEDAVEVLLVEADAVVGDRDLAQGGAAARVLRRSGVAQARG